MIAKNSNTSPSVRKIGCDDGHDSIKTCSGFDNKQDKYLCTRVSSKATQGIHQVIDLAGQGGVAYETAGKTYSVTGEHALNRAMDTRVLDYPVSDLNRILVAHALIKAGFSGANVSLVTGLPVDQFYVDGAPNKVLISNKTQSLLKPVSGVGKSQSPAVVVSHKCVSEAIAAFYDALLNGDGSVNDDMQTIINRRPVAVVDLGGKTLDMAVIAERADGIYNHRSGTANVGVISLYDQVTAQIKSKFALNNDPPLSYVEEAFRTKSYEFFGEPNDVSDIIEECCQQYAESVKAEFTKKIGDGSDLGAVIFVGGGTALLLSALGQDVFKAIYKGKTIIPTDPEFSNARGMWKAAEYIYGDETTVALAA